MIIDHGKVIDIIATFLANQIKASQANNFMIRYDGTVNSFLNVLLCEKAREKCGAKVFVVNDSHSINFSYFQFAKLIIPPEDCYFEWIINFSQLEDCLIISSLNKTNGIIERKFNKYLDVADIYPLLDLYHSEVLELHTYANKDNGSNKNYTNHELLEWADRENLKNGIITDSVQPTANSQWFKYTKPQKEIIAQLHQREKLTRHKDLESSGRPIVLLHGVYPEIIR